MVSKLQCLDLTLNFDSLSLLLLGGNQEESEKLS